MSKSLLPLAQLGVCSIEGLPVKILLFCYAVILLFFYSLILSNVICSFEGYPLRLDLVSIVSIRGGQAPHEAPAPPLCVVSVRFRVRHPRMRTLPPSRRDRPEG